MLAPPSEEHGLTPVREGVVLSFPMAPADPFETRNRKNRAPDENVRNGGGVNIRPTRCSRTPPVLVMRVPASGNGLERALQLGPDGEDVDAIEHIGEGCQ